MTQIVFDYVHIHSTPRKSQVDPKLAALPPEDLDDGVSRPIGANVPSSSEMSSLMARRDQLEKEKEKLTMLFTVYKIWPQNAEQCTLKKYNMLNVIDENAACLLEGQESLKAENRSLFLVNSDLGNKSNKTLVISSASRH